MKLHVLMDTGIDRMCPITITQCDLIVYGVVNLKRLETLYKSLPLDLSNQWAMPQSFR